MRARAWIAIAGVGVAVALAAGWFAAGRPSPQDLTAAITSGGTEGKSDQRKTPKLVVTVVKVEQATVPIAFEYTGTIVSPADATLQAQVTGVVTQRPFQPGSAVKKGDLLFQIDQRPFDIALQTAQAQKKQAEASLSFAEAQVDRATTLTKKGFETRQRTQQLESQRIGASSQLDQAEAAIARQKLNIDYATIRAPFDGRVSLSQINVGDTVTADQTQLASVVQVDPVDLQIALSAEDSEAVQEAMGKGMAKVILLNGDGKPEREARIYKLDNHFDPRTARRLVRALVHNADGRYLPGQFVRSRVEVGTRERLMVPTVALSTELDQRIVYVVDAAGKVSADAVETGSTYGDKTAILNGLEPGASVAIDHLQRLHDGSVVRAKEPNGETASSD